MLASQENAAATVPENSDLKKTGIKYFAARSVLQNTSQEKEIVEVEKLLQRKNNEDMNKQSHKGYNIFLKNRSVEKIKKRIQVLTKWIWQIDHYSNPTNRQLLDRNKYFNQKEAMLNELEQRAIQKAA